MLRIIAGKYKSLRIEVPNTFNTRPTQDKVREAIMSAINTNIDNAIVLDLFAGSGAMGLEAYSRGASKIYFCDKAKIAINTIKQNLAYLKINDQNILMLDYKKALDYYKTNNIKFDIVFLDPPYKMKEVYEFVENYLITNNLLNNGALIIEESDCKLNDSTLGKNKHYKYGTTYVKIISEIKLWKMHYTQDHLIQ